jgi:hypothetical protein
MKIVEFFLIIWGKLSELEPELEPDRKWTGSVTLEISELSSCPL